MRVSAYYHGMSHEDLTQQAIEALLAAIESRDLPGSKCITPRCRLAERPMRRRRAMIACRCWRALSVGLTKFNGTFCRLQSKAIPVGMSVWIGFGSTGQSMRSRVTVSLGLTWLPGQSAARDYVDLGEWRRSVTCMTRLTDRSPSEVVSHHLDAVTGGDSFTMAAFYLRRNAGGRAARGLRRLLTTLIPCRLGWRSVSLPLGPLKPAIGFGLNGTFQEWAGTGDWRRNLYGLNGPHQPPTHRTVRLRFLSRRSQGRRSPINIGDTISRASGAPSTCAGKGGDQSSRCESRGH